MTILKKLLLAVVGVCALVASAVLYSTTDVGKAQLQGLIDRTFDEARKAAVADLPAFNTEFAPANLDLSLIQLSLGKETVGNEEMTALQCRNTTNAWFSGTMRVDFVGPDGRSLQKAHIYLEHLPPGAFCTHYYAPGKFPEGTRINVTPVGKFENITLRNKPGFDFKLADVINTHKDQMELVVTTPLKDPALLDQIGGSLSKLFNRSAHFSVKFLEKLPEELASIPREGSPDAARRLQIISAAAHGAYSRQGNEAGRYIASTPAH